MLLSQQLHPHPKNQGSQTVAGCLGRECSLPLCCMGAQCRNGVHFNCAFQHCRVTEREASCQHSPHMTKSTLPAAQAWPSGLSLESSHACMLVHVHSKVGSEVKCKDNCSFSPSGTNQTCKEKITTQRYYIAKEAVASCRS